MVRIPAIFIACIAVLSWIAGLIVGYSTGREMGLKSLRQGIDEVLKIEKKDVSTEHN